MGKKILFAYSLKCSYLRLNFIMISGKGSHDITHKPLVLFPGLVNQAITCRWVWEITTTKKHLICLPCLVPSFMTTEIKWSQILTDDLRTCRMRNCFEILFVAIYCLLMCYDQCIWFLTSSMLSWNILGSVWVKIWWIYMIYINHITLLCSAED